MARDIWHKNNSDCEKAFKLIENVNCVEKFLLSGLSKAATNDYFGAFQSVS
jgi:hypothetical protein